MNIRSTTTTTITTAIVHAPVIMQTVAYVSLDF